MASYLAHAVVSGIVILLILWGLRAAGIVKEETKWSWPVFGAVLVVMFLLNLVWPWPS